MTPKAGNKVVTCVKFPPKRPYLRTVTDTIAHHGENVPGQAYEVLEQACAWALCHEIALGFMAM